MFSCIYFKKCLPPLDFARTCTSQGRSRWPLVLCHILCRLASHARDVAWGAGHSLPLAVLYLMDQVPQATRTMLTASGWLPLPMLLRSRCGSQSSVCSLTMMLFVCFNAQMYTARSRSSLLSCLRGIPRLKWWHPRLALSRLCSRQMAASTMTALQQHGA